MAWTSLLSVPFPSKHSVLSTHHQNFHIYNIPGPPPVGKSILRLFLTKKKFHNMLHVLLSPTETINGKNSGVFFPKQSFQEPEETTRHSDTVRTQKWCWCCWSSSRSVSGPTWKREPEACGCGYHDPPWKRDTRLPLKLSKTPNVSFQGRQTETKSISYFLRNISANMQPTLQRSTGVA